MSYYLIEIWRWLHITIQMINNTLTKQIATSNVDQSWLLCTLSFFFACVAFCDSRLFFLRLSFFRSFPLSFWLFSVNARHSRALRKNYFALQNLWKSVIAVTIRKFVGYFFLRWMIFRVNKEKITRAFRGILAYLISMQVPWICYSCSTMRFERYIYLVCAFD